jgi:mRNA interferase MazF
MKKDFKNWHNKKTSIDNIPERPFFHEKEIWFCYLGVNVGFEQDGMGEDFLRPVVVVKKFNDQIFWGLPLTRSKRTGKYYFAFQFDGKESKVILSQIKLIDAKRLSYFIGEMSEKDFNELKEKIKQLLA